MYVDMNVSVGVLRLPGGKYPLLKQLLPLIPHHRVYVEAFGGAAHLLFHKFPAQVEVLNDVDRNIITLQDHQDGAEEIGAVDFPYAIFSPSLS